MAVNQCVVCVIVTVILVICLVFIILMSLSFATLNFYEYGFIRDRTAGNIETSKVFGPGGWYPIGPNQDFKIFRADAHFLLLKNLMVATNDKLEITMTVNIVYFLRKHDLTLLLRQYDAYYEKPVQHNAIAALKEATTVFSKNEFLFERKLIEDALLKSVRDRLEGQCCIKGCKDQDNCVPGCVAQYLCTTKQKGLFVDVRFFQLTEVSIPKDIQVKYLNALVLMEATVTEEFKQEVKVVEKNTVALVKQIENLSKEILSNATADSSLITAKAKSSGAYFVEKARAQGLKHMYTRLNLTSAHHRNSFDYLMELKNHPRAHISVDYNQLIAGGFK